MPLPQRVFVIAVLPESGRDPDRMTLLSLATPGGVRLTPVFSSMQLATSFLSQGQELGYTVRLDYIFPVDGAHFVEDFPDYGPRLDLSPEAFFLGEPRP